MLMLAPLVALGFVVSPTPLAQSALARRAPVSQMVDIPRVTLPGAVTDILKDADLSNPNDLSDSEYNSYSAAAIGGTLIFFLLPIFNLLGFAGDFVFSALIGGGAAAYASLRKDQIGEYGNKFGGIVLQGADKVVELVPEVKKKVEDLLK